VATRTLSATVTVGKAPHWVTPSSDGRFAYVANEASGDVSVVDLADRRVVATIPVGQAPRKIVIQPSAAGAAVPPVPVVQMDAEDYGFRPTSVAERAGTLLRLRVTSRSSTLHNFTLPAQRIDRDIAPGETVEIELEVPASGSIPFCKFHAALGQRGELIAAGTGPPVR
jgi:YVTN family beta-propeller protein